MKQSHTVKIATMLHKIRGSKYGIENNRLVNVKTGIAIPEDEPVFILRAQDSLASSAVARYAASCSSTELRNEVTRVFHKFIRFWRDNPDRVKVPD